MIGWNVIAALSSFASLVTWIVQYAVKLRTNVMVREDREREPGGWSSSGKANIGHSFWLVVVAFALFCLNVTILHFLRKKRVRTQSSKRAIVEATTKPNGNLMLYWSIQIEIRSQILDESIVFCVTAIILIGACGFVIHSDIVLSTKFTDHVFTVWTVVFDMYPLEIRTSQQN